MRRGAGQGRPGQVDLATLPAGMDDNVGAPDDDREGLRTEISSMTAVFPVGLLAEVPRLHARGRNETSEEPADPPRLRLGQSGSMLRLSDPFGRRSRAKKCRRQLPPSSSASVPQSDSGPQNIHSSSQFSSWPRAPMSWPTSGGVPSAVPSAGKVLGSAGDRDSGRGSGLASHSPCPLRSSTARSERLSPCASSTEPRYFRR